MRKIFLTVLAALAMLFPLQSAQANIFGNMLDARGLCNANYQKDKQLCLLLNTDWGLMAVINDKYTAMRIIGTTLYRQKELDLWNNWAIALGVSDLPKEGRIAPDNSGELLEKGLIDHLTACIPSKCITPAITEALRLSLPKLREVAPNQIGLWNQLQEAFLGDII